MAKKSYSEKLRDPRWQKLRLKIMERDGFACVDCSDTKKMLSVHHLIYKKGNSPWEYKNNELITLCEFCHKIRHLYAETKKVVKKALTPDEYELAMTKTARPVAYMIFFKYLQLDLMSIIRNLFFDKFEHSLDFPITYSACEGVKLIDEFYDNYDWEAHGGYCEND